jgi:hypothetical protein
MRSSGSFGRGRLKLLLTTLSVVGMMVAGIAAMTYELRRPWPLQGSDELSRMMQASSSNTILVTPSGSRQLAPGERLPR